MVNYTLFKIIFQALNYKSITLLGEREGRVISVQEPGKQGVSTLPARIPEGGDRCQLPMIQGPCRMAIEQFYYDAEKGECFVFYYGGCKVNRNCNLI